MNQVVQFPKPYRERVEIWSGISHQTGNRVWMFDMFIDDGACNIHDAHSLEEAQQVARELQSEGNTVIWKDEMP
ncbi:hypothetical protein KUG47_13040 [Falsochrobactrum sp. TDYN1]|uniref:Uncharacterized protein n=1 Tax=Falsochrobactrum tianjinense TaxID=2706015 RepID=A0A949UU17_9HYPH|nr:hypothetical protein [Falsochrobactrum sp. TDYN1]MBV2144420.1 hypothetical protein [Falsochrobactrum sp. TDYN1]